MTLHKWITEHNDLREKVLRTVPAGVNIRVPPSIHIRIQDLRDETALVDDIWMSDDDNPAPLWMTSDDVRSGIRGMHVKDRCEEELLRVRMEGENLYRWFCDEMQAVAAAALQEDSESPHFGQLLARCLTYLDIPVQHAILQQLRDISALRFGWDYSDVGHERWNVVAEGHWGRVRDLPAYREGVWTANQDVHREFCGQAPLIHAVDAPEVLLEVDEDDDVAQPWHEALADDLGVDDFGGLYPIDDAEIDAGLAAF